MSVWYMETRRLLANKMNQNTQKHAMNATETRRTRNGHANSAKTNMADLVKFVSKSELDATKEKRREARETILRKVRLT